MEGRIFNIMKYCIHDGPGIRATVFLKGCPLKCWWCHNPESQEMNEQLMQFPNRCIGCKACIEVCKQNAIVEVDGAIITLREKCIACGECSKVCYAEARQMAGKNMPVDEVVSELLNDRDFYQQSKGGVTFSGGEPLMQPEFLFMLLKEMKRYEVHTAVDTSGFASRETIEKISEYTDVFLYDLKHMDSIKHEKYTGVNNHIILGNLKFLLNRGKEVFIRIPIIPSINDSLEELEAFSTFIRALPKVKEIALLPYHKIGQEKYNRLGKTYRMKNIDEPSKETMLSIAEIFKDNGINVKIGG